MLSRRFRTSIPIAMKNPRDLRILLAVAVLTAVGSIAPASSSQDNPKPVQAPDLTGLHDFDFLVGQWQVYHRR